MTGGSRKGGPVDSGEAKGAVAAVIAGYGMNLMSYTGILGEDPIGPLRGKDQRLAVQAMGDIFQVQTSDETFLVGNKCRMIDYRGRACSFPGKNPDRVGE